MNGTEPPIDANEVIEAQLDARLAEIERLAGADTLTYIGAIGYGVDVLIREALDGIKTPQKKLLVVLETDGGSIEVTERIARAFRQHYKVVDFLVPDFAFSAGTVLVMSGDAIYMNPASVLGPIDPQVQRGEHEQFVPALGYLEQYDRLIKKSAKQTLTPAELLYLVESFDPAALYQYEQQKELSIALLKEWLVKYKFTNWTVTEGRGLEVTPRLRAQRSRQIATILCDTQRWHSHGRGIPMDILRSDLRVQIEDYDAVPDLSRAVRAYYGLLSDYRLRRGHWIWLLHTQGSYSGYGS
ncbi:MAG TPA: serine dehydrogenasease [Candidatus Dormibacteraeota bacterium]|nr:serine dehydrogenasease [Candidatus Dormibacteraeota bacterium]